MAGLLCVVVACLCAVGCPGPSVSDSSVVGVDGAGVIRVSAAPAGYVNILPDELKLKLDAGEDLTVIDVRTATQYQAGHLPTAVSMPLATLPWAMNRLDRDRELVVYCQVGVTSVTACNILAAGGFSNVKNLVGGLSAWPYEVVTGSTSVVSL